MGKPAAEMESFDPVGSSRGQGSTPFNSKSNAGSPDVALRICAPDVELRVVDLLFQFGPHLQSLEPSKPNIRSMLV